MGKLAFPKRPSFSSNTSKKTWLSGKLAFYFCKKGWLLGKRPLNFPSHDGKFFSRKLAFCITLSHDFAFQVPFVLIVRINLSQSS
jgi:hypothetical protein